MLLLHLNGCPDVFIKIVYFILVREPVCTEDLVDSLEVFSGTANYTKASLVVTTANRMVVRIFLHAQ